MVACAKTLPVSVYVDHSTQAETGACAQVLAISKQMVEAQEMFRTANRVTRPEKALILGFMAGSRDNPCPHLGNDDPSCLFLPSNVWAL